MVLDKRYEVLLRQSIETQTKLNSTLENHNEVIKNLSDNLSNLNNTIVTNNQGLHNNMEDVKVGIKELSTKYLEYIKWLTILSIVIALTAAGLKVSGVI